MIDRPPPLIESREASAEALEALQSLPVLQRQVFAHRGITDLQQVDLSLDRLLPLSDFPVCTQAAELLHETMRVGGHILFAGDYDADGATGVTLGVRCLRAMGHASVDYIVPDRFRHGYGFCVELLEEVADRHPDLIVTVDNGMSSIEAVAAARKQNIKVLITDHHLPGPKLPDADCIVNPNSPPNSFPSSALAGVGTLFYVMLALRTRLREHGWFAEQGLEEPNMAQFLDLVAIGTVADVVPLDQNNRILVEQGLRRIRNGQCIPGIVSLLRLGKRDPRRVGSQDLAFVVGPYINAAGRMDDIALGIRCLLTDQKMEAHRLAEQLQQINQHRRDEEGRMHLAAIAEADALLLSEKSFTLCLYQPDWHEGVVGIIAARLREQYDRPAIVFARGKDGNIKGSGRSIQNLHLRDVLVDVAAQEPDLLQRFGGHAMAVGLTIAQERLECFQGLFEQAVSVRLNGRLPQRRIQTDGELPCTEWTLVNAEFACYGHPWGKDFPAPVFEGEFLIHDKRIFKDAHMRLQLSPLEDPSRQIKAMAFSYSRFDFDASRPRLKLIYCLQVDEYGGQRSCMLNVQHMESL